MKTTLDIDYVLLMQAKSFAASEHTSLTRLIEEGLALRLRTAQTSSSSKAIRALPVYAGRGGAATVNTECLKPPCSARCGG